MPNLDVLLKGYSGDPLLVDRVGRPSIMVMRPMVSAVLTVQPDVLESMGAQRAFRGRGFLARWLYALPLSIVGQRITDPVLCPPELRREWESGLRWVYSLPESAGDDLPHLELSPAAHDVYWGYRDEVETRLSPRRRPGGPSGLG